MAKRYWLLKTESRSYSIDDLVLATGQSTSWQGVCYYQARNLLGDALKVGD